jgi:hypothetical protein
MNFQSRFSALMATALIVAVAPSAHANEIQIFPPVVEGTTNTVCPSGTRAPLTWDGQSNVACAQGVTMSGGNVGIGTTEPASQLANNSTNRLDYTGNGLSTTAINWTASAPGYVAGFENLSTGNYFNGLLVKTADVSADSNILDLMSGDSSRFIVNGNGYVGIGKTAPASSLDILGHGDDYAFDGIFIRGGQMTATGFPTAPGIVFDIGDEVPDAHWGAAIGAAPFAGAFTDDAQIGDFVLRSGLGGDVRIGSIVNVNTGSIPTNLIVKNSGYVGIGTSLPEAMLDVNGVVTARGPLVTTQVATGYPQIFPLAYFDEYESVSGPGYARIASVGRNPSTRGGFLLYSGSSDNSNVSIPYMTVPNGSQDYTGINIPVGSGPSYTLDVNGNVHASNFIQTSDRRHKTEIQPLAVDALDTVAKLKPVTFMWKDPADDGMKGREIGFIAQDVQTVLPDVVSTADDADKTLGLKYDSLIPVLTKAIQELKTDNDAEAGQIKALTDRLEALEAARR